MRKFSANEKSTFPYWFAHWKAFNKVAKELNAWKFKYIFHDIEKPWLKLFWDYPKVQKWHNEHNSHHLINVINGGVGDWEAMIIDWECSGRTKIACKLNAAQEYERIFDEFIEFFKTGKISDNRTIKYIVNNNINLVDAKSKLKIAYVNLHIVLNKFNMPHKFYNNILD